MNISKLTKKMLAIAAFSIAAQAAAMNPAVVGASLTQDMVGSAAETGVQNTVETLAQDASTNVGPQVTPGMMRSAWNYTTGSANTLLQLAKDHPYWATAAGVATAGATGYGLYKATPWAAKKLNAVRTKRAAARLAAAPVQPQQDQPVVAQPRFGTKAKIGTAAGVIATLGAGYVANRYGYMPSVSMPSVSMPSMETVKSAASASVSAVKSAGSATVSAVKAAPAAVWNNKVNTVGVLAGAGVVGYVGNSLYNKYNRNLIPSAPNAPAKMTKQEIDALAAPYQAEIDAAEAALAPAPRITAKDAAKSIARTLVNNPTSGNQAQIQALEAVIAQTQDIKLQLSTAELVKQLKVYATRHHTPASRRGSDVYLAAQALLTVQ